MEQETNIVLKMTFKGQLLEKYYSEKSKADYLTFYCDQSDGRGGVSSGKLALRVPEGKRFNIPQRKEHTFEVDLCPVFYGKNMVLDIADIRLLA